MVFTRSREIEEKLLKSGQKAVVFSDELNEVVVYCWFFEDDTRLSCEQMDDLNAWEALESFCKTEEKTVAEMRSRKKSESEIEEVVLKKLNELDI